MSVRAAVVAAHERVPERFPWSGGARRERQQREGGQPVRIVRQDGLVALDTGGSSGSPAVW